jgi:3-methyl-2-oxobutanoate hydroxymethyltransferase
MERKKVTISDLMEMKRQGKKITMLTAYDYPMAYLEDKAGIDIILIGDSLSMVVLGHENTLPVTMDEMIHHAQAVKRGAKFSFLVGDMPFMSYNINKEEAIRNAGRFIKEAGCDCIKLEGGLEIVDTVKAIVDAGIPVMGHLGLTPQTATKLSGFKVQGKDADTAQRIINSAVALEQAGAFAVLMECVPDRLAGLITKKLKVPTIGIGAGPSCDGQVLIIHDMVGLYDRFLPKFAKQYVNLSTQIVSVLEKYREEVQSLKFPAPEHCFTIKEEELKKLK